METFLPRRTDTNTWRRAARAQPRLLPFDERRDFALER